MAIFFWRLNVLERSDSDMKLVVLNAQPRIVIFEHLQSRSLFSS